MASLTLRFNTTDVTKNIRAFKSRYPKAVRRALNRAAVSTRAVMASAIARDLGLKVGTVKDEIKIQDATETSFIARVSVSGKRIPLIDFGAKGPFPSRGRGTVRVKGRQYPGAFIAQMRSGHMGVFRRVGVTRLPILELRGASLPHVFGKYIPLGLARGTESLTKNIVHELRFAASVESQ